MVTPTLTIVERQLLSQPLPDFVAETATSTDEPLATVATESPFIVAVTPVTAAYATNTDARAMNTATAVIPTLA